LAGTTGARSDAGRRLRACVLLAGHVGTTPLLKRIKRGVLDLPIDDRGSTLLDHWLGHTGGLAELLDRERLHMRVLDSHNGSYPAVPRPGVAFERDPVAYRGTGGIMRDATAQYDPDDLVLFAAAGQYLTQPLLNLWPLLSGRDADVTLITHRDGTPSGLCLVRCGALRELPAAGFVDFKEQGLSIIGRHHSVVVVDLERASSIPIRTHQQYLHALRVHHEGSVERDLSPFDERWKPVFSVVEQGARVGARARVHNSVVLRGGVLEPSAIAVRSVICDGGQVDKRGFAVDAVI
jgi:hypothetical protein